jgi:CO/xanthine dehydrogenase Mo-binding subunit/aerobic-type carbon monoxide dehydrogenase small subunit (CoxS/CutS family)
MTRPVELGSTVRFTLNGRPVECIAGSRTTLRDLLHDELGCNEVKLACAEGVCGACAVLIDGKPLASCIKLALQAEGREVTTGAGLCRLGGRTASAYHALRDQMIARECFQCGYCAPGFLVEGTYFLANHPAGGPTADEDAIRHALSGHICRCTGYQQIIEAVKAAAADEPAPPAPELREDERDKVDGVVRYPTDHRFEGQLVGRVLWSEHASALITGIDVSEAMAVPGVVCVLTHHDVPGRNIGGESLFRNDQPLLAVDRVSCMGDAVALIAAETEEAARLALRRIKVLYQVQPAIFHPLAALAPEAPNLGARNNTVAQFIETRGDVERGFRESEVVVEGTYECGINDHVCMEREGGVGRWDGGTLEITIPSLTPHRARNSVARCLGVAEDKVRINTPRMGGSFGKYLAPGIEALLGLLVYRTNRPVQLILDREEILSRRPKRHPIWGKYKLGTKRDGTFVALEADVIADSGPYVSLTPTVVAVYADEAAGAYHIPHLRARARGVLTNNLLSAPMRGFGSQQIKFGIECVVAKAAEQLGIDPVILRKKNYAFERVMPSGEAVPDAKIALLRTIDTVVERFGDRPVVPEGWLVGRGIASIKCKYGYPYGLVDRFVVRVGVGEKGRFFVESDVPDSGTGILAAAARIVSRELELDSVPETRLSDAVVNDPSGEALEGKSHSAWRRSLFQFYEKLQEYQAAKATAFVARLSERHAAWVLRTFGGPINVVNSAINRLKSWSFPHCIDSFVPRTSGSRGMLMVGSAALDAVRKLRDSACRLAAPILGSTAEELTCGAAGLTDLRGNNISWAELAKKAGGVLCALGSATIPAGRLLVPGVGNQVGAIDHMFTSHGVDIAVKPETGEVKVLRYVACQDVGKALNPEIIRGQILGSIAMGFGQALMEKIFVENGAVKNQTIHDYLIPTMLDAPVDPEIIILESGGGFGPHGAKGIGEAGAVAAPAAVAHALYDALGTQFAIPVTPEEIAAAAQGAAVARRRSAAGAER